MTRIGIISAYPDEDWHSRRITAAAAARADDVVVLAPVDFTADAGPEGQRILVRGEPHQRFDVFLTPRALGDEGDHELQVELYKTLAEDGALLVNDVRALTTAIDKFKTSWILARGGVPTPRAIVVQRLDEARWALASLGGRAVAKPLYGSLGIGVERIEEGEAAEERLTDRLQCWRALYLQAFVDGGGRDLRAFVVGRQVVAAIARVAPPGEFRTNVHLGGRPERVRLAGAAALCAVRATELLALDYAGVDLLEGPAGPVVLEVNGTPLFRGILEATGLDMSVAVVEHALERVARRAGRRRGRRGEVAAPRRARRPKAPRPGRRRWRGATDEAVK